MRREPMGDQDILARLQGRRILVLGRESEIKECLIQELREMSRRTDSHFEVLGQGDVAPEDYVILMGTAGGVQEKTRERGTQQYSWIREKKGQGEYLRSWTEFRALADILLCIQKTGPAAAVFVSDSSVYGKLFGDPHLIREEEIGYLCHTDEDFQDGQTLRTLEHLCGRLAREHGVNIRIARLQNPLRNGEDSRSTVSDMAELLVRAMLLGAAGEPYNIPGLWQVSGEQADISPLSPNLVVEDLSRVRSL